MPTLEEPPDSILPGIAFEFFEETFRLPVYCVNAWLWLKPGLHNAGMLFADRAWSVHLIFRPPSVAITPGTGLYKVEAKEENDNPKLWAGLLNGFGVVREFDRKLNSQLAGFFGGLVPTLNLVGQRSHGDVRYMCEQSPSAIQEGVFTGVDRSLGAGYPPLIPSPFIFGYFNTTEYPLFQEALLRFCVERGDGWKREFFPAWGVNVVSSAWNWPLGAKVEVKPYGRKKRFAGRTDLPRWREEHKIISIGKKFRRQQVIVAEDNQAGGRGRAGTGIRKLLAKAGDIASDALLKALTKEVKKRSKVAGAAAGFAVKLAKAALRKKAATAERQRKRGLKPTVRSKKIDTKQEVQARYDKEVKAAARGVEVSQVKQDKELERIIRRQKAAIKRENRKILAQRRRWLKHQNKIEREKRKFAKQVARLVKEADKKALRKFSFRQKRPCLPTQQRRRPRRRRLTSRGRASRKKRR